MNAATVEFGLPVEIGRIDKELGRLWEESGDTKTRASLINLAIYTESAESMAANTELIASIAGEHACRALLILANPAAAQDSAKAWINAHCFPAGKGDRQICSEQITFQLDGEAAMALPNLVFSHLDSDLPLCVWWQAEFRKLADERLWQWVDRLIYDSREWTDPSEQFERVREIAACDAGRRITLCDLNWARLLSTRFAMAQFFDNATAICLLEKIHKVRLEYGPGFRTSALLLLGWFASRLGWKFQPMLGNAFFVSRKGVQVQVELAETEGGCVSLCRFDHDSATIEFRREKGSEYFHASLRGEGLPEISQLLPGGREKITDTLLSELSRGGRHPQYVEAFEVVRPLFQSSDR